MDLQPTLENKFVIIRPLNKTDLEPLYEVAKDPKIWKQHPCKRYLRTEFEHFFAESLYSDGALTILDKMTNKVIGSSRFKRVKGFQNGIEIGWTFLSRKYWGGKYNKMVKDLMINHAFNFVDNIIFYINKTNIRSQKAVEKIHGQLIDESEINYLPKTAPDIVTFIIKKTSGQQSL